MADVVLEKATQQKIEELSVQKRVEPSPPTSLASLFWFVTPAEGAEIAPWWSEQRDKDLRDFWMQKGNDILQGAVSSMVKKFKAMNWTLDGPSSEESEKPKPGTVEYHQPVLAEAEFGLGWGALLTKSLTDYLTQDKGLFWELIGRGDPNGPMKGLPVGVAHLDAGLCQLTGDPSYPVLFRNPKDDMPRRLHTSRVAHMADMTSPIEAMNGTGFCAVSRVVASSNVLLKLAQYKNEKLDDLPQAGLLLLNNIMPTQWEDILAQHERGRRNIGHELWSNVMTLIGLDPAQPTSADFISFADLPDNFDELQSTNIYVNIVALAFGVDPREFWPISAGPLGTATEALVMHQKARGKGVGDLVSSLERVVNWKILPETVHFKFDFQDDEEDKQRAEIQDIKTKTIMSMWVPPRTTAETIEVPPVNRLEIRQMLASNVDYFIDDFLKVDITEETQVTDTEREKAWKDVAWEFVVGPKVTMDRFGAVKAVPYPVHLEKQIQQFKQLQREYRRIIEEAFTTAVQDRDIKRGWREFSVTFRAATKAFYPEVFKAGLAEGGVVVDELNPADQKAVDSFWKEQNQFAIKVARRFFRGRKQSPEAFLSGVDLWVNRLLDLYNMGVRSANKNQMLTWVLGMTEEHCTDCLRLKDQKHRAFAWDTTGWVPQASKLECGGYRCDCRLVPTTGRASGRF